MKRTKRGQNEGSIYQRATGRWIGAVTLRGPDGTSARRYFSGETRRDVSALVAEALKTIALGGVIPADKLTVARFLAEWLQTVKPSLRPSTWLSYERHVRLYVTPALGHIPLTKLTPASVQTMLANLQSQRGLSPQTVAHVRATLRGALGQAERWDYVNRNVARLTDPPRIVHREVQPFTEEEVRAFLKHVRDDRMAPLYTLALATGARQGELLGLRWSDIDPAKATITIRSALQRIDGVPVLVEPKSARSRRTIAIPPTAVAALREQRHRQVEERLAAGDHWQGTLDLVFTTSMGRAHESTRVTKSFQASVAKAGMRPQRFHDLRHAAASMMLAHGVSPRVVMDTLGHSTIAVTMNIYGHVLPVMQREAADEIERALTG